MKAYSFLVVMGLMCSFEIRSMNLAKALREQEKDTSPVHSAAVLAVAGQRLDQQSTDQIPQQGLGTRIVKLFRNFVWNTKQSQIAVRKERECDKGDEDDDFL